MSDEQHIPKKSPSGQSPHTTDQQPRRSDELSSEDLDQVTGGLLPAVAPEK